VDADKILTTVNFLWYSSAWLTYQLITIPNIPTFQYAEQSINNIVMLKQYVISINPIYEALIGAKSSILQSCREVSHLRSLISCDSHSSSSVGQQI
jgi:hypothetical protein